MGILGELDPQAFLQSYWQQQPKLFRQSMPNYAAPIEADELAGLALEEEVESRLVLTPGLGAAGDSVDWQLRHGPFTEQDFAKLPETGWTLLVQGLNLWVPEVKRLCSAFDFLPPWRMDDIMASYAVPGGGVGPHFDHYDVFLFQVQGERRWSLGQWCDSNTALMKGQDLKILREFELQQEWILHPGDMLYVPPGLAHWGTAVTECVTYSIGFRAPSLADMIADLGVELAAQGDQRTLADPPLNVDMATSDISAEYVSHVKAKLQTLLDDDALIGDWLARFMTQPKYGDLVDLTQEQRQASWNGVTYLNGDLKPDRYTD